MNSYVVVGTLIDRNSDDLLDETCIVAVFLNQKEAEALRDKPHVGYPESSYDYEVLEIPIGVDLWNRS